jgi:protein phosphatase
LAGGHLYHPVHTSDLALTDLVVTARTRVRSGLSADNRGDAERIVANLGSNEVLPLCKPPPTPSPTPTPTPTPKPSPHKPRPSTHSSRPAPHTTAHRSATPTGHAGGGGAIAASPRPSLTITAGATPVRGKDCR